MRLGWLVALAASMALVAGGIVGAASAQRELRSERDERLGAVTALSVAGVDADLTRIADVLGIVPADASAADVADVMGEGVNVCVVTSETDCARPQPLADTGISQQAEQASRASGGPAVVAGSGDVTDEVVVVAFASEGRTYTAHIPARGLLTVDISRIPTQLLGLPRLVDAEVARIEEGPTTRGDRRVFALPVATEFADGPRFVLASMDSGVALPASQRNLFALLVTSGVLLLLASIVVLVVNQRRLSRRAVTDDLTGLVTRREFHRRAADAIRNAAGEGRNVAVIFVDLDHFKDVNDEAGHHVGDAVLMAVAERLVRTVRDGDVVARWGGDEFAVLLPGATLDVASVRAHSLRESLAGGAMLAGRRVSATAGVAVFPEHGSDTDDLVRAADEAMYAAKRSGQPIGVSASPSSPSSADPNGEL
ncbi:MAG: GGDEF domain-containing protein [Actinomycetota bacterium]|nr:GGDEF domain-containing protein [Actinomycetota bacterium]